MKSFFEWLEGQRFAVIEEPFGYLIKVIEVSDLRQALKKLANQLEYTPRRHAVVSLEGEIGLVKLFDRDETRRVPPDVFSRDGLPGGHFPNENPNEWPLRTVTRYSVVSLDAEYRTPEARDKQMHALSKLEEKEREQKARELAERRRAARAMKGLDSK